MTASKTPPVEPEAFQAKMAEVQQALSPVLNPDDGYAIAAVVMHFSDAESEEDVVLDRLGVAGSLDDADSPYFLRLAANKVETTRLTQMPSPTCMQMHARQSAKIAGDLIKQLSDSERDPFEMLMGFGIVLTTVIEREAPDLAQRAQELSKEIAAILFELHQTAKSDPAAVH